VTLRKEVAASMKAVATTQVQIVDVGQAILDDNELAAAKEELVRLVADHATRMSALAALDEAVRSFESIPRRVALFFAVVRRLARISSGSELFGTVRTPAGVIQLVALLLICEIRADAGKSGGLLGTLRRVPVQNPTPDRWHALPSRILAKTDAFVDFLQSGKLADRRMLPIWRTVARQMRGTAIRPPRAAG
jgi:hypothetical protein